VLPVLVLACVIGRASSSLGNRSIRSLQILHWRGIGPLRAAAREPWLGVPSLPKRFLRRAGNGACLDNGLRSHVDADFDDQPTGSVGCIAVAASNPDVVYVGRRGAASTRSFRLVTAYINQPMRAKPGLILACVWATDSPDCCRSEQR